MGLDTRIECAIRTYESLGLNPGAQLARDHKQLGKAVQNRRGHQLKELVTLQPAGCPLAPQIAYLLAPGFG
jgi:hypothetical protein